MKKVAETPKPELSYVQQKRYKITYASNLKEVSDALAYQLTVVSVFPWQDHIVVIQEYYE